MAQRLPRRQSGRQKDAEETGSKVLGEGSQESDGIGDAAWTGEAGGGAVEGVGWSVGGGEEEEGEVGEGEGDVAGWVG